MKQFVYDFKEKAEIKSCLNDFKEQCPNHYSSILASLFTCFNDPATISELTDEIKAVLPQANVVGMTSSGGIKDGEMSLHSTILSIMVFDNTWLKIFDFDENTDPVEAGDLFLVECQAMRNLQAIEFLATLHTFNARAFMQRLDDLPDYVTVFGGGADTYNAEEATYVFADGKVLVIEQIATGSARRESAPAWTLRELEKCCRQKYGRRYLKSHIQYIGRHTY